MSLDQQDERKAAQMKEIDDIFDEVEEEEQMDIENQSEEEEEEEEDDDEGK